MKTLNLVTRGYPAERFQIAAKADACVQWLKSLGLSIRNVEKSKVGLPLINIRPAPQCAKFEDVIGAYERAVVDGKHSIEKRYSYVYRMGCEVRWEEGSVQ